MYILWYSDAGVSVGEGARGEGLHITVPVYIRYCRRRTLYGRVWPLKGSFGCPEKAARHTLQNVAVLFLFLDITGLFRTRTNLSGGRISWIGFGRLCQGLPVLGL